MPLAIILPAISNETEKIVRRPQAPTNPPSLRDITNSFHFSQDLLDAHARKQAKDEEVVNAEIYKNKVLSTREGNEPAWFTEAMGRVLNHALGRALDQALDQALDRALVPIKTDIQSLKNNVETLKDDVRTVKGDVRDIKEEQAHLRRIAAKSYNRSTGTGDEAGFAVVPFADGQDPTKDPHNLPPLNCSRDVRELGAEDRDRYYRGYYPADPQTRLPRISERSEKIFLAIGAKNY